MRHISLRNKCLQVKGSYSSQPKAPQQTPQTTYKPQYHKTTTFAAAAVDQPEIGSEPAGSDVEGGTETEDAEAASEEARGTYLPELFSDSPIADWSINIKMANAIQANEHFKKRCFECNSPDYFIKDCPQAKNGQRPQKPMGPHKNQLASVNGKGKTPSLYAHSARAAAEMESGGEMIGQKLKGAPYLNPDPFQHYIGPKNWSEVMIDGELATCLLDNGSQLYFMTPAYAIKRVFNIMSLECLTEESGGTLPPINCLRGGFVKPIGFVIVNVQIPCVKGTMREQIVIVMDDPNMEECPVLLGTPTIYHVMPVIKESEITKLSTPWATSRLSWMFRSVTAAVATPLSDVANKTLLPTELNDIVRTSSKVQIPPFGHKIIHGKTGLILQGYKMNIMTHGLEKRSPQLPLGMEVLYSYATLVPGSDRVSCVSLKHYGGLVTH